MTGERGALDLDRLKAISNGVFAVILTILILTLEVPGQAELQDKGAGSFILLMEPQLRAYGCSFTIVAILWLTQTVIFHFIQRGNRTFIWLNLLFLLIVALNPFLTDMRSTHAGNGSLALIYSGSQIICFLLLILIWHYSARHLSDHPPSKAVIRSLDLRILGAIACYVIGAALVGVSERLATLFYTGVPLLFFIRHQKIDAAWQVDNTESA